MAAGCGEPIGGSQRDDHKVKLELEVVAPPGYRIVIEPLEPNLTVSDVLNAADRAFRKSVGKKAKR